MCATKIHGGLNLLLHSLLSLTKLFLLFVTHGLIHEETLKPLSVSTAPSCDCKLEPFGPVVLGSMIANYVLLNLYSERLQGVVARATAVLTVHYSHIIILCGEISIFAHIVQGSYPL